MSRRLALRVVAVAAAVVVVLVVTTLVMLPTLARWLTVWQLASATGRKVTLEALDLELFNGRAGLRGLRVIDPDGGPLLTVDRAEVRFSPRDLAGGHLRVMDAAIHGTAVRIVRTGPDTFNVSDLLRRRAEPRGSTSDVTIERFAFVGGVVALEDRTLTPPRTWRVEALELQARDASTVAGAPPGVATLRAAAAGSPISVSITDLRLAPLHFQATLDAREIEASLAGLYLPPASPLSPTRGRVTVSATMNHDAATGTLVGLDAGFVDVELHRPGQERAYLSAPAVRVKVEGLRVRPGGIDLARLAVDGDAIGLEDTRLVPVRRWQIDGLALEARNLSSAREAPPGIASARAATAGARLEVWVTNARLAPAEASVTAIVRNVDLSLVRLYLPPELPIHAERGVVNATVRVEHDAARGTRLGVDAGLTGIELRRPGTFVSSPAVRVTVDDITLDRGAVSVGRVNLTGDRLTLEERAVKPARTWPVQNLVFEARDLSSRRDVVQGVASLRATIAGASASIFVTDARLEPLEYRATTILRNADAHLFQLYLPPEVPVSLARGTVNATLQVGHILAEGTRLTGDVILTGLEAKGRGPLATLAVTSPSLRVAIAEGRRQGEALSVGRVELSGSGLFTDARGPSARFDVTEMRLASEGLTWPVSAPARLEVGLKFRDRGELEGSGTARLTAPLPTLAWAAEAALQLRAVDLAPLAAYIPAAAGLGGRVRANVTANVAYAGSLTARIRGDVGGARFAILEGKQSLVSLRGIDATGLDLQWPERMTIQRVRLRQPHAIVTRDRQGAFPLATRFAAPRAAAPSAPGGTPSAPAVAGAGTTSPTSRPAVPKIEMAEVVVEGGSATFVDETAAPPVRVELPRVNLTARSVTWPASAPITLALEGTFPEGGTVKTQGTVIVEPPSVDVTIAFQDAVLAALQPYWPFRARIAGKLNANLAVAGPLTPPRLKVKGDVGLRGLDISDVQGSVLTADGLRITGIDADWPTRIAFDRVRVRTAWALIERDAQGGFTLRRLLERAPGRGSQPSPEPRPSADAGAPRPAPPTAAASTAPLEFSFREGIFAGQSATIIDAVMTPPARVDISDARLTVRDFAWPPRTPAKIELSSPMPAGGRVDLTGTVLLDPVRIDVHAVLDAVAIEPAQPYLPIDGRVAGKVTGDVTIKLALEPTAIQIGGQARLQTFRLNDGDRAVVTVGRVDTAGIDVDWPKRIAFQSVQFRRPRLLIERDQTGTILLRRLVTPRWTTTTTAPSGAPARKGSTPARPPVIDVANFSLERASARFVDYGTTPTYAEEVENLSVTLTPLTTDPGRRTRFAASGGIGGGSFKLSGEGAYGDRPVLDLKLDLRDFIVPRANPYVLKHTGWMATNGMLSATGSYALEGSRLDTRHDLLIRGLEVVPAGAGDEVQRRVGLPFGMLVSLLKDSRGEIKLSLPVSADLSSGDFEYREAMWGAVRSLSIRLLALPFSKIGSLFVSNDSKVTAVALGPVVFQAGTDRLGPEMEPHLERVGNFLRGAPALKVVLEPALVESDVQALKQVQALTNQALPPEAMRTLGSQRIEVVRQALTRAGIDAARLSGTARRVPLVEASGQPRVEFDLRP